MRTVDEIQTAMIGWLKSQPTLVALLSSNNEIKEHQWQGTDFVYPAVRSAIDLLPTIEGCGPDKIDGVILSLDEQKSSKRCSVVAAELTRLLHRRSFSYSLASGDVVTFTRIIVTRVTYPVQEEGMSIWQSQVQISGLVN